MNIFNLGVPFYLAHDSPVASPINVTSVSVDVTVILPGLKQQLVEEAQAVESF